MNNSFFRRSRGHLCCDRKYQSFPGWVPKIIYLCYCSIELLCSPHLSLGRVTLDIDEHDIGWSLVCSLDLSVTGLGATGNQVSWVKNGECLTYLHLNFGGWITVIPDFGDPLEVGEDVCDLDSAGYPTVQLSSCPVTNPS